MERVVNLHIEKLPKGVYLAISDAIQGLVAQGRTIQETIDIARDVARSLSRPGKNAKEILCFRRRVMNSIIPLISLDPVVLPSVQPTSFVTE
jgi:hypothetical protein